jgi:hypothetical protein
MGKQYLDKVFFVCVDRFDDVGFDFGHIQSILGLAKQLYGGKAYYYG